MLNAHANPGHKVLLDDVLSIQGHVEAPNWLLHNHKSALYFQATYSNNATNKCRAASSFLHKSILKVTKKTPVILIAVLYSKTLQPFAAHPGRVCVIVVLAARRFILFPLGHRNVIFAPGTSPVETEEVKA